MIAWSEPYLPLAERIGHLKRFRSGVTEGSAYLYVYASQPRTVVPAGCHRGADWSFAATLEGGHVESDRRWVVVGEKEDLVIIESEGLRSGVPKNMLPTPALDGSVRPSVPFASSGRLPGFVTAGVRPAGPSSRLYLNIGPHQARWALHRLSPALLDAGLPHLIKVLAHPSGYFRTDAAVLYVPSADESVAVGVIRSKLSHDGIRLSAGTPGLTLRVDRGLGVADDVEDLGDPVPESHGRWVARLCHEASSHEDTATIASAIAEGVGRFGRDPRVPYRRSR